RKRKNPQMAPPEEEQDSADEYAQNRNTREKEFRAEDSGKQHENARNDHDEPKRTGITCGGLQASTTLPHEVRGDRDDEEPMRVVVVVIPVAHEFDDHLPIEKAKPKHQEGGRQPAFCRCRHRSVCLERPAKRPPWAETAYT